MREIHGRHAARAQLTLDAVAVSNGAANVVEDVHRRTPEGGPMQAGQRRGDKHGSPGSFWPGCAMPLCTGARERQFPIDDAIRITREVADALEYAHGIG